LENTALVASAIVYLIEIRESRHSKVLLW